MSSKRKHTSRDGRRQAPATGKPAALRIIGGRLRGRKLLYGGDQRTRPMKDRTREAVFNLLGPAVVGKHAIDLFAGTGALGLEAISRGAARATMVEQHFPTAALVRQNAAELGVAAVCEVAGASAFIWTQKFTPADSQPWLVFCSPPYAFYAQRHQDMLQLIETLATRAPSGSIIVVESDRSFDTGLLPQPESWDIRVYPPAVVAISRR